jgi:hypothetical protein
MIRRWSAPRNEMSTEKSLSRAPRTSASCLHRRSQELHACVGTGGAGRTLLSSGTEDDGARRRIRIALRLLPLAVVSTASETN